MKASTFTRCLHKDPQYDTGTDRLATLTNGEALAGLHRDGTLQLDRHRGGVTRNNRVGAWYPFRKGVCRPLSWR